MGKFGEKSCSFDGRDPGIEIPLSELNGTSNIKMDLSGELGLKEVQVKSIRDGDNIKVELRIDDIVLTLTGIKGR